MFAIGLFILFPIGLWSQIFPTKSVKREEEVLILAKETLLTTMAVQNKVRIDNFHKCDGQKPVQTDLIC